MTKTRRRAPTLSAAAFGAIVATLLLAFSTTEPAVAAFPGVNGKIAFDSYDEVYSMNPDGSGLSQLTHNAVADDNAEWSPDGTKVAFTSERDKVVDPDWGDFATEIYVMNADGTNARRITNNAFDEHAPTWSPDGKKLVYTRNSRVGASTFDVYASYADGTGETRITAFRDFSNPLDPVWSPDGSKIALHMYPAYEGAPYPGVFVMNADGSGLKRLVGDGGEEPEWSPNGEKIAYADYCVYDPNTMSCDTEIRTVDADGSATATLAHSNHFSWSPEWSPDGEKVAFLEDLCRADGGACLKTVDADGSDELIIAGSSAMQGAGRVSSRFDWGAAVDVAKFAPLVYLHPDEDHWPMSAGAFIKKSKLMWSHGAGCGNHELAGTGTVVPGALRFSSGGPYQEWPISTLSCNHKKTQPYSPGDFTRPRDEDPDRPSTLGEKEGFYLDLDNDFHKGSVPDDPEVYDRAPVYYEVNSAGGDLTKEVLEDDGTSHQVITYWFFSGRSIPQAEGPDAGQIATFFKHEGDWEHVNVHLNVAGTQATQVDYFAHHEPATQVLYSDTEKSGTHPVVYSAYRGHGSFPEVGAFQSCDIKYTVQGCLTDRTARGRAWQTWNRTLDVRQQPWYDLGEGYGGAWGRVGTKPDSTGPLGPSPYKDPLGHG